MLNRTLLLARLLAACSSPRSSIGARPQAAQRPSPVAIATGEPQPSGEESMLSSARTTLLLATLVFGCRGHGQICALGSRHPEDAPVTPSNVAPGCTAVTRAASRAATRSVTAPMNAAWTGPARSRSVQ